MKRRGGFTLIELLIVVMIIGILAGMVLLSMGPVLDSVRARGIQGDLRTVLSGAVVYFAENYHFPSQPAQVSTYINKNLTNDPKYVGAGVKFMFSTDNVTPIGIGLVLDETYASSGVQKKLGENAADLGALSAINTPYVNGDEIYLPLTSDANPN